MRKPFFLSLFILLTTVCVQAQWDGNPATVNNPVCNGTGYDENFCMVSDGAGGMITVWRQTWESKVSCQRVNSNGTLLWGDTAAPVDVYITDPFRNIRILDVKPDGNGGAYMSWRVQQDDTTFDIFLQHVDGFGNMLFPAGGLRIVPVRGTEVSGGKLCPDAAGVIISWSEGIMDWDDQDLLYTVYAEAMVQRYSATGLPQWGQGVPVSTVASFRGGGEMVSDGQNGAYVVFSDNRNSTSPPVDTENNLDIYAQHISSSGTRLWGGDAKVVCNAPESQYMVVGIETELFSMMVPDGAGGFIVAYDDYNADKYVQRINSNGDRVWDTGGIRFFNRGTQYSGFTTEVVSDGANGVVVTWDKNNVYTNELWVYAQRIKADGTKAWSDSGIAVSSADIYNDMHCQSSMVADGTGSYVAAWVHNLTNTVRGQKINANGQLQWGANGVPVCTNPLALPLNPFVTKSNGNNIIALWEDARGPETFNDLYAAKIDGNGNLVSAVVYSSVTNGNWNDPAIWQGNVVPPAGANVVIRTAVTGNVSTACNSLSVLEPGSLTLNAGINITVLH